MDALGTTEPVKSGMDPLALCASCEPSEWKEKTFLKSVCVPQEKRKARRGFCLLSLHGAAAQDSQ